MVSNKIRSAAAAVLCFFALSVSAHAAADPISLIPVGRAVGIEIETQGVIVTAVTKVDTPQGEAEPAFEAGLRAGDIIEYIGPQLIESAADFRKALDEAGGTVSLRYTRGGRQYQTTITPVLSTNGHYELGVWLRSGMAGIGTVTFYDPGSGCFGALGHPVSDMDTGVMLPVREGAIYPARISSVVKGQKGEPGELKGYSESGESCGTITKNCRSGLSGTAEPGAFAGEPMPVMKRSQLKCGEAYIISDVGEGVKQYSVEISRVYHGVDDERDMLITVTDEGLISVTGGIVQGMSGSPIIQNGMLAGAVTHVLINDPTKGYAISMESMLEQFDALEKAA